MPWKIIDVLTNLVLYWANNTCHVTCTHPITRTRLKRCYNSHDKQWTPPCSFTPPPDNSTQSALKSCNYANIVIAQPMPKRSRINMTLGGMLWRDSSERPITLMDAKGGAETGNTSLRRAVPPPSPHQTSGCLVFGSLRRRPLHLPGGNHLLRIGALWELDNIVI